MKLAFLLTISLVSLGCGSGERNVDPKPDAGSTSDAGPRVDASDPNAPGVSGTLRDEAGEPLREQTVLGCMATVCLFGKSDGDGRFFFQIAEPASVAVKTPEDLTTEPRRGVALYPVKVDGAARLELGDVFVPSLPAGARLQSGDPQTLAAGGGLELTVRREDLKPRAGTELFDIAAREIPRDRIKPLAALEGREIVAMYALHPFAAKSKSPISVRAPSTLPSGTAVDFRTISELDGHLSEPVIGHSDGVVMTTDPGQGLTELTWLVISR